MMVLDASCLAVRPAAPSAFGVLVSKALGFFAKLDPSKTPGKSPGR